MTHSSRALRCTFVGLMAAAVAACGGGDDGGGASTPIVSPPPPPPPFTSSVLPTAGSLQFVEGSGGQLSFTVTTNGATTATVVPVVNVDPAVMRVEGAVDTSVPNQYTVRLATVSNLAPGVHQGQVGFRLCSDVNCTTEQAGGQQSFSYTVDVGLLDWATFQRNAGHTGFVNVQLDPARFSTAWQWSRPAGDSEPIGGINAVATGAGKVFVSKDIYFGQGALYALDEANGSVSWTYALGRMASLGPPAYADGRVYLPSNDPSSNCAIWSVDAALGTYLSRMSSACQWSSFFAPTPFDSGVFHTADTGVVYNYFASDGSQQWAQQAGAHDQATPAVDSRYVYQYGVNSAGLRVFDRLTGAAVATIADPFYPGSNGYSMFSAPMLGSTGNVFSFSGGGFSGRAASSSEQYDSRVLVNYDVARQAVAWRSANAYLTHPALANGVVYVAGNSPASLDALSEADGRVLWSWTPPAGEAEFHRNIVVTRNLVFVSTSASVYAIDLNTHQQVWRYPRPGMLAISAGYMLYIATGSRLSDGDLVAIRLR